MRLGRYAYTPVASCRVDSEVWWCDGCDTSIPNSKLKNDASDMEALNAISAIRSSQTQSKCCRNEFGLFQVRRDYWSNDFHLPTVYISYPFVCLIIQDILLYFFFACFFVLFLSFKRIGVAGVRMLCLS